MTRRFVTVGVACLGTLLSALGVWPTVAAAQEVALATRGPRFLQAPSPTAPPVEVDVRSSALLRRVISLNIERATVKDVLVAIEHQTGVKFIYSRNVLAVDQPVRVRADRITVAGALTEILIDAGVDVLLKGNHLALVARPPVAVRQVGTIVGRVADAKTKQRIAGVEVFLEGTRWRTTSDTGGSYRLADIEAGDYTLTTRRFGYAKLTQPVTVAAGQTDTADVELEPVVTRLDELVTTATGPQRRMELANAVTVLRADSIVRTQPIKDVTDLLETRVPGLATLPTTGAPGDPTRLRLRGSSSILRSNDPIVIVDGVRVYAAQSDARNASLAWSTDDVDRTSAVPAPSPLDRIDPNSIETLEVLNGPSAATLYGADAANGVIVITTKRGRPGPARWDASLSHGRSDMPGRFPDTYIQFAHDSLYGFPTTCRPVDPICSVDSVLSYQLLNDPDLTVLGQGHRSSASLTVSGGRPDVSYAITGSYSDEVGLLELPEYEADHFRTTFGRAPEDWMERPHHLTNWSFSGRFDFKLGPSADVAITTSIAEVEQGRSDLEQQLQVLRATYVDKASGLIYRDGVASPPTPSLVPDFYRRTINRATAVKTGVNLSWRPLERLTVRADAGLSTDGRRDESLLPRGLRSTGDTEGFFTTGQGSVRSGTLNAGANYVVPLRWGFRLGAAVGFNYTNTAKADVARRVNNPDGIGEGISTHFNSDLSSYGWFIEPRISHQRFSLATGLRLDSGSEYGARASGLALPKIGGSWLISDEPFFPLKNSHFLSLLRLRAAYGQAGVQPGPTDRLRLLQPGSAQLGGESVPTASLATLGNTKLRPERSTEIEGGFDADFFSQRLTVGLTVYRKTKNDAHLNVPVAASVYGAGLVLVNIGVVRNTGFELALGTNLLHTDQVNWTTQLHVSRNRNVVVSLAEGLEAFGLGGTCGDGRQCIRVGYPLFGYWERPIMGYTDANGDGVLQDSEILLSDSAAYLGAPEPTYVVAVHTTVGLFRQALSVIASLDYQDGLTQQNAGALTSGAVARAALDPSAPLAHQALARADDYALFQTVSTLRFHSLSLRWKLPAAVAQWFRFQQGSLALQATNLGLITNYRGKDPLVNSVATGNAVVDAGALPQPREWRVQLNFSY